MITGIDHVVILVDGLESAMRRFEALGFEVVQGGAHPAWGTENALIPLADGSYLELLAARDPALASRHRLWQRPDGTMRAPGTYGGYALGTDDVERDVLGIRARGLDLTEPQAGARQRPDGQTVRWRLSFSARPHLPFLIEDETPRPLRIAPPGRGLGLHAGIDEVVVSVSDLDAAARAYEQLLGVPATRGRFQTPRGGIELRVGRLTDDRPTEARPVSRAGVEAGVRSVVLGVRRWAESTRAIQGMLQSVGDAMRIDPARIGGVRLFLRHRP